MIRNSADGMVDAKSPVEVSVDVRQEGNFEPRVSGSPEEPSKSNVRYAKVLYAVVIILLTVAAVWGLVLVLRPKPKAAAKNTETVETDESDMKKRWFNWDEYDAKIDGLSEDECVAIFNIHHKVLVDPAPRTLPGVTSVEYRAPSSKSEEVRMLMSQHENRLFSHLYKRFEQLSTTDIAIRLGHLKRYVNVNDDGFKKMMYARQLFRIIIGDEKMRKYLAFRGLRRKIWSISHKWTWGTVIFRGRKEDGYKVVPDDDGLVHAIGDWNKLNKKTADRELSGTSSLKDAKVYDGTKRILELGTESLPRLQAD